MLLEFVEAEMKEMGFVMTLEFELDRDTRLRRASSGTDLGGDTHLFCDVEGGAFPLSTCMLLFLASCSWANLLCEGLRVGMAGMAGRAGSGIEGSKDADTLALRSTEDFAFLGPFGVVLSRLDLLSLRSREKSKESSSMSWDRRIDVVCVCEKVVLLGESFGFGDEGFDPTEEWFVTDDPLDLVPVEDPSASLSEVLEDDDDIEETFRSDCCFCAEAIDMAFSVCTFVVESKTGEEIIDLSNILADWFLWSRPPLADMFGRSGWSSDDTSKWFRLEDLMVKALVRPNILKGKERKGYQT
jgi:hypothetical protein